jgi:hypothetical protein
MRYLITGGASSSVPIWQTRSRGAGTTSSSWTTSPRVARRTDRRGAHPSASRSCQIGRRHRGRQAGLRVDVVAHLAATSASVDRQQAVGTRKQRRGTEVVLEAAAQTGKVMITSTSESGEERAGPLHGRGSHPRLAARRAGRTRRQGGGRIFAYGYWRGRPPRDRPSLQLCGARQTGTLRHGHPRW